MKQRSTKEQISVVRTESEAGAATNEPWRKHGISVPTLYNGKATCAGMAISEAMHDSWAKTSVVQFPRALHARLSSHERA
jgi:hypothetical protein